MNKEKEIVKKNPIIIYTDKKGNVELRADVEKETIWATQAQIAQLFDVERSVVTKHISNVFKDGEINQKSNVQKMHIANADRPTSLYSLDIILAVGYRTNSKKAILFRKWSTQILRNYIIKGVAVNNHRVEQLHTDSIKDIEEKILFIQETIRNRRLDQPEIDGIRR